MGGNEPTRGRTLGRTQRQLRSGTKALRPSGSSPKRSSSITYDLPGMIAKVAADAIKRGSLGAVLGQNRFHAARAAGRKATASISIFALSSRPATCTAVLVGGSFGKNSPRMRENTA